MTPCKKCNHPKTVKETLGCCVDRLYNSFEDLKEEASKQTGFSYTPDYHCRYSNLVRYRFVEGEEE